MLSSPVTLLLVHHSSDLLLYGLPQQWNELPELEKSVLPTAASPAPAQLAPSKYSFNET